MILSSDGLKVLLKMLSKTVSMLLFSGPSA